jgi:hypothetical protein
MALLPVEAPGWLDHFKAQIVLESSIIRKLIQWGFTESAFDIYKKIEERFNDALESQTYRRSSLDFYLPEEDKIRIREVLRQYYVKTREIPRRRGCRELLQNGLLTGFEELSGHLVQLYEQHLQGPALMQDTEKVAKPCSSSRQPPDQASAGVVAPGKTPGSVNVQATLNYVQRGLQHVELFNSL